MTASKDLFEVVAFIPAYNEEESISRVIDRVSSSYSIDVTESRGYRLEIIVVNDGSEDRTEAIARSKGVRVVSHTGNLGLGAATRTGMQTAFEMDADATLKLDADFQHDPEDLDAVIRLLLEDRADICWGSRFAGSINYKMPVVRRWGNKFFTWLMNKLTNYHISDAQTGLMAFNRRYLRVFELHGNYNPPQQLLMDANFKNMRYAEVPVEFHPRTTGKSFVSWRYPLFVAVNIFRLVIYANPLKVFSCIGCFVVLSGIAYLLLSNLEKMLGWDIALLRIENLSLALLIVGLQSFFFGLLADIIMKKK